MNSKEYDWGKHQEILADLPGLEKSRQRVMRNIFSVGDIRRFVLSDMKNVVKDVETALNSDLLAFRQARFAKYSSLTLDFRRATVFLGRQAVVYGDSLVANLPEKRWSESLHAHSRSLHDCVDAAFKSFEMMTPLLRADWQGKFGVAHYRKEISGFLGDLVNYFKDRSGDAGQDLPGDPVAGVADAAEEFSLHLLRQAAVQRDLAAHVIGLVMSEKHLESVSGQPATLKMNYALKASGHFLQAARGNLDAASALRRSAYRSREFNRPDFTLKPGKAA